jgi:hypothetical protein
MDQILHHRWQALFLATSFIAATSLFTIGLVKIWAYQHPDSKVAHGLASIAG